MYIEKQTHSEFTTGAITVTTTPAAPPAYRAYVGVRLKNLGAQPVIVGGGYVLDAGDEIELAVDSGDKVTLRTTSGTADVRYLII